MSGTLANVCLKFTEAAQASCSERLLTVVYGHPAAHRGKLATAIQSRSGNQKPADALEEPPGDRGNVYRAPSELMKISAKLLTLQVRAKPSASVKAT